MSRLEKKCLVASTSLHALLLLVLFVGPAFLPKEKTVPAMPPLDFVPTKLVDALISGGGSPSPAQAAPTPPAPTPPAPQPPQPEQSKVAEPETPEPDPTPAPPKVSPVKPAFSIEAEPEKKPKTPSNTVAEKTSKPQIKVNLDKKVVRPGSKTTSKTPSADKSASEPNARQAAIGGAVASLNRTLSGGTAVSVPGGTGTGGSGGGEAVANYAQFVREVYDRAWVVPGEISDRVAPVEATVTIGRDGRVVSARILSHSGNSALDKTVQDTLSRVKFVAPFPAGAKEPQRTYTIEFNLKHRRQLG